MYEKKPNAYVEKKAGLQTRAKLDKALQWKSNWLKSSFGWLLLYNLYFKDYIIIKMP